MQPSLAESKAPSALSTMVHTNLKTTENLGGTAKRMRRWTLHVSRLRRATHVLIHSDALIVGAITKPTLTSAHSRGIDSTENSTKRSVLRSMKTGSNRFALWRATSSKYDFEKPQYSFTKCSQEPSYCQYYPQDSITLWHYSYPRTTLCCDNHLSQGQMIIQGVNLLSGYLVGNSQENLTRSLFLIIVLFIQILVFNDDIPNQHLLLSQTSSYYLKLWLCSRQTV